MSDDDWDKRHEEYEAHVDALSATLRTCPTHGNPANIEKGYEGDTYILASECGCWSQAQYYDSIDALVAAWNDQPQIDRLTEQLAELKTHIDGARWPMFLELRDKYVAQEATILQLREQLAAQNAELVEKQKYILEIERAVSELQAQLAAASDDLDQAIAANGRLQAENSMLFDRAAQRLAALKEAQAQLAAASVEYEPVPDGEYHPGREVRLLLYPLVVSDNENANHMTSVRCGHSGVLMDRDWIIMRRKPSEGGEVANG